MRKFLLTFLFALLLLLTACNNTKPTTKVEEDQYDLSKVIFEDASYEYTGYEMTLDAYYVPDGVTVTYSNNGFTEVGTYDVTATFTDPDGNVLKTMTATLTITPANNGPDISGDIPTTGTYYLVVNGDTYYQLIKNESPLDPSFEEYMVLDLNLISGDIICFYDVANKTSWVIGNVDEASTGEWSVINDGITCVIDGLYDVYLKFQFENDQIYFGPAEDGGTVEPNPDLGGDIPTTGTYYLVVNGDTYYELTKNGSPLDPSFEEYQVLELKLEVGDDLSFYNVSDNASWVITKIDSYSNGNWSVESNGILCNEAGTFDVYLKLQFENDQIYFGYSQ